MLSRLKFDIGCLFEEIYNDRLPDNIFSSDKTTFTDIQSAGLQSILPLINKLREYGHSDENIRSRVFSFSENEVYLNYVMVKFSDLPVTFNLYKEQIDMKFDVVIGNPPYQKKVGPKKTEAIWPKFVEKSFEICKEGGYVSLIHPSGWRNIKGNYKETQNLLKSKNIIYLDMYSDVYGMEIFNASINFDSYLVENVSEYNGETLITDQNRESFMFGIRSVEFIPDTKFNEVLSLVAKEGEETVDILHSYSNYETRKPYMSKVRTEEHTYPCVSNVTKSEDIKLLYSSTNGNGHFGITKLICGSASSGTNYFMDINGDYGITQFSFGIIDTSENIPLIKKVMKSKEFQKIIKAIPNNSSAVNYKILSTFRKDFWRDFLDEDNNVIEPNYNVERV